MRQPFRIRKNTRPRKRSSVFRLARKPLAERVEKKLRAMDKKILLW